MDDNPYHGFSVGICNAGLLPQNRVNQITKKTLHQTQNFGFICDSMIIRIIFIVFFFFFFGHKLIFQLVTLNYKNIINNYKNSTQLSQQINFLNKSNNLIFNNP